MKYSLFALGLSVLALSPLGAQETTVATWQGGKKAPFMLMFDDGCPSHITNVFPLLKEKGMVGTYYIVPAKGEYLAKKDFWENVAPKDPSVVYANHSMTHKGTWDVATIRQEIEGCNAEILKLVPGKTPRLISYGPPGGPKILASSEEVKAILAENHLINRPEFKGHGAAIHYKTSADVLAAVDESIASGKAGWVVFHGVGGDWLKFPAEDFGSIVEGLEARRDSLWITDPISVHKYETELATAKIEGLTSDAKSIRYELKSEADPALYDLPLTVVTKVPAGWKGATVTQGTQKQQVAAKDGSLQYEVLPNGGAVTLSAQ